MMSANGTRTLQRLPGACGCKSSYSIHCKRRSIFMHGFLQEIDVYKMHDSMHDRAVVAGVSNLKPATVCASGNSTSPTTVVADDDEVRIRSEVTRRIKALGRQGKVKDAIKELAGMARMGVQPDTLSATALIDACVRSRKMDMAESVFDELFGDLLKPDEVAFMVLIRGYGDEYPPRWTNIATILSTMEHTYGIIPTVLTFNTLLEICSKTNDEDRGIEIIDKMQDGGIQPNDLSFEAVKQRKSLRSMLKKLV